MFIYILRVLFYMFRAKLINNNLKGRNLFTLKTATGVCWFRYRCAFLMLLLALLPIAATAGFLEMPDTTEVPQFERESLLLDMDIPPVRERDPDPQAGPRLNVKEFRIQGIIEYPELGITREKIIEQVEAIRFDMMAENKLLES